MLAVVASPALGATYWVTTAGSDAMSCNQAQSVSGARRTLAQGVACLQPGDTLQLGAGTWNEQLNIAVDGVSLAQRTTIQGAADGGTRIVGQGAQAVRATDREFVAVRQLVVQGPTSQNFTIELTGRGFLVEDVEVTSSQRDCLHVGSSNSAAGDNLVRRVWVHDCGERGIRIGGPRSVVEASRVSTTSLRGIEVYDSSRDISGSAVRGCLVENTNGGIRASSDGMGNSGDVTVVNNVLVGVTSRAALSSGRTQRLTLAHNTVVSSPVPGIELDVETDQCVLLNNLVAASGAISTAGSTQTQSMGNLQLADAGGVFAQPATRDFHLVLASPAVDSVASSTVLVDFDGNPRPGRCAWDCGAYELQGACGSTDGGPSPTDGGSTDAGTRDGGPGDGGTGGPLFLPVGCACASDGGGAWLAALLALAWLLRRASE